LTSGENNIDIDDLDSGVYFVKIDTQSIKIVKE
jgi:hypothetical protein